MTYLPPDRRVTRRGPNGPVTLTALDWAILADAYKAVGLEETDCVVTQGSWHKGTQSGTTHNGAGAGDQRVWNIPAPKVEPLVVELRKRGLCAWKRDKAHGGFDPHIHWVNRYEFDALASGAQWQVRDYDRGGNGLQGAAAGKDYHPRPVQHPFAYRKPAPYPGKPIGWPSPRTTSTGPAIETLEKCFGLPVTGRFSNALSRKITGWQLTHPGPTLKDRVGPGAAGPSLYAGIVAKKFGA